MSLTTILLLAVIFCALVIAVQSGESRAVQGGALSIIVLDILVLLILRGDVVDVPGAEHIRTVVPAIVAVLALFTTFRTKERSLSLVLVFAALLHFFVSWGVIEQL